MRLAPSLHRIGSDYVNCYLVDTPDGLTLIDAGIPGHWDGLLAELRALGRPVEDIRGVVLTHGDTDHLGIAERLRRDHGVPVHVHELDAARARREPKQPNGKAGKVGVGATAKFLWHGMRNGAFRVPGVQEVTTFTGDDTTLDLPGAPRIVRVPGHTPGSVVVHVPGVDAVFVGDTMTTRNVLTGVTGPAPAPFTLHPGEALASLDRLDGIEATWVLPGHGAPWDRGLPEALDRVRAAAKQA
ncbi:MBL fold metallo-hydrolase [Streptomyces sp. SGAir0957]